MSARRSDSVAPVDERPRVAIAAPSVAAADAGRRVAELGGNGVDAALAASLVTMVNEPGIVALSSGAFITVQPPDGSPPVTIDGWVEMPGRGLPAERFGQGTWDVTTAYGGGTTMTVGPGSVATHGTLAAFELAHTRWGELPWAEVVAPAVDVARTGSVLGTASRRYLEMIHDKIFGWDTASHAAIHDPEGRLLPPEATVVVADLATSLELIARDGADAMYGGELGAAICDSVVEAGGILTRADLLAYEPQVRPSLAVRSGPWSLGTTPPPSVGGVCVAAMLLLMDGRPRGGWTTADTDLLLRVQRSVLRHRLDELDLAPDLTRSAATFLERAGADGFSALESPSTTHVSTVDIDGTACAVTASAGYGSGMIARGTGIWLNNCLGEIELNRPGLHALAPGTRLSSNMAPTVGRRDDGAVLATGSPGADRISTAVAQVLAGLVGGLGLREAIDHPRLHTRLARVDGMPDVVEHEEGLAFSPTVLAQITYPLHDMYFGAVATAFFDPAVGVSAAGDPRRDGTVRVGGSSTQKARQD